MHTSASARANPYNAIPGPKPLPIIGNVKEFKEMTAAGRVGEDYELTRLTRHYGDIYKLSILNNNFVVINDADAIRKMFKYEGSQPSRGTRVEKTFQWVSKKNNIPTALFVAYKNDWKKLRVAMNKQVIPQKLLNFTEPISEVTNDLCNYIEKQRDKNQVMVDICPALQMWAMKGITKIVFNEDLNVFSDSNAQAKRLIKAVVDHSKAFTEFVLSLPLYKIYPTKSYRNLVGAIEQTRNLANELLDNHYESLLADIKAGAIDPDNIVGLLDQWLIEGKLTEEEAVIQACDMITGGIDTTSNAGIFLLHELAKNPPVQELVFKQIMEVVGMHESPTTEQLQKLSLVRNCIKETLRLHPPGPLQARETEEDIEVLGYHIPAKTVVFINFFSLGTDPRYFKDPLQFIPERWNHNSDYKINQFASLPFGFGPRMCYGRRIAELELFVLLIRILQRYSISSDQQTLKQTLTAILHPQEPVSIKFLDRK